MLDGGGARNFMIRPSQKLKSEYVLLKIVMGINKRNDPISKKPIPAQYFGRASMALKQVHLHPQASLEQ